MNLLGILALLFGVLGVIFTIKERVIAWPLACLGALASLLEFYQQRLYGDMSLQVFYFFAGIYGWVYWQRRSATGFSIFPLPVKKIPVLVLATLAQFVAYYFTLKWLKGDQVVFDAILTACSLTATYMMTKKWVENWVCWVVVDAAYVILYCTKHMWLFAVLYFCFTLIAMWGWLKWKKTV